MRILVLGGTQFLGRHVVEAALERGHDVTLFNRGQTRPELFPEVEKLRGDRDGDLSALEGRAFDAVVDTSGYVPRVVQQTLDALPDVGHYTFVSSISAYGPLKALCEEAVRARFDDAFIPRPGLIVGPWDPTGRFTYWPQRFDAGGQVLAPLPADGDTQVIDVRDLALWIVEAAETRLAGTYNAVGPVMPRAELLEACRASTGVESELVWVDPAFLVEQGVEQWMELPLWLHEPEYAAMLSTPAERAVAAGLRTRPIEDTARDTLEWVRSGDAPPDPPAGLDREKERRVLDAWLSKD